MKSAEEQKTAIKEWLASMNPAVQSQQITDDLPIIEEKILSSMQVMDLLLFLESLRGSPVNPASISPGSFKSVQGIYESFIRDPQK